MGSLLKRYREPVFVVGLLAASFLAFFAHAKKGASLNAADRVVVALTAPVERVIVGVAFAAIDAWSGYVALRGVSEENLGLRRQNFAARRIEQESAELKQENERLRRLLDFADKQGPLRLLVARVVAVGASPHSHTLRIDRGSGDGVARGAAVIAPEGIVGTVAQLTGSYADVQLIVSPLSAVPALSQRTRSRYTVKGTGDIGRCNLQYANRTDDLQETDLLVTAGGSGFFPQGLRIGRVTNVRKKPVGLFLDAEVLPAVDFTRLDEVTVVMPRQPEPHAREGTP